MRMTIDDIMNRIDRLENKIDELMKYRHYHYQPPIDIPSKCSRCGIQLSGTMGYVCNDPMCPCGFGSPQC